MTVRYAVEVVLAIGVVVAGVAFLATITMIGWLAERERWPRFRTPWTREP